MPKKSDQIQRLKLDPGDLDFETLKNDGISKIQALCGEIWTDYNLHDPGVTILEQFCYGLTELSYQSAFEVKDYLVREDGNINYEKQALFLPQDIFPCSPVTFHDYYKILYDAIPEISNIWFRIFPGQDKSSSDEDKVTKDKPKVPSGLISVFVEINDNFSLTDSNSSEYTTDSVSVVCVKQENLRKKLDCVSNTLYELGDRLDTLGDSLDTQHDILEKHRGYAKNSSVSFDELVRILKLTDGIVTAIKKNILPQLDSIFSCLTKISCKLGSNQTDLIDGSSITKLDAALFELSNILSATNSILDGLPELRAPKDLFVSILLTLEIHLRGLDTSLCEQEAILLKTLSKINDRFLAPSNASNIGNRDSRKRDEEAIKREVYKVLARNRNLCEDIDSVHIVRAIPYFLDGEIEILPQNDTDVAKIYAEIFFECAQYISFDFSTDRYEYVFEKKNYNYEEIFTGPLTLAAFINKLPPEREVLEVVQLIERIKKIDGVNQVRSLYLINPRKNIRESFIKYNPAEGAPSLCLSKLKDLMQSLKLVSPQSVNRSTEDNRLLEERTKRELKKRIVEYYAYRSTKASESKPLLSKLIKLPVGEWRRGLQKYYSIQNQFPAIYGINRNGVPRSELPEIQAKAKQLKAYLFPFEQLMANYLKGLHEIHRLFSLDAELKQSYFSQELNNQEIPNIEELYVEDTKKKISDIREYYDNFADRRNRLLDTLLAMYGEEFPQQLFQRFNYYRRTEAKVSDWIIKSKIDFLENIVEMSRDRANGFDYYENNIACIQKKLSILLGLSSVKSFRWLADVLLEKKNDLLLGNEYDNEIIYFPVLDMQGKEMIALDQVESDSNNVDDLSIRYSELDHSILKEGIDLANYQLVCVDQETEVYFKSRQDTGFWRLGKAFKEKEVAIDYARQFCNTVIQLNMKCEGLHIVEHILLRPRGNVSGENIPDPFYNFRVSVIFPSWTARFSDQEFRKYVQEMVQQNLPAHVFPYFYWLNFEDMQVFEERYRRWLSLMQQVNQENSDNVSLNSVSKEIISFLLEKRQKNEFGYWV